MTTNRLYTVLQTAYPDAALEWMPEEKVQPWEEGREVRVEYQPSYEALCDIETQGNALNWAEQAKKKDEVQTFSRVETLVEGLNLAHMG